MAQNYKPNPGLAPFPLPPTEPAEVHPQERERVAQLISSGKSDKALDLCKDIHRRRQSADSASLLLDAYGARFRALLERNLEFEAKQLMNLVRERYPSARDRLAEWQAVLAARNGDLNALLAPLNDPALPPERHAAIAAAIRRDAADLRALSGCRVLAPEHPLRTAAAALSKAFDAVTSGPVAEEAIALPEVSRQSPLAPWKMLVRAIAAYYRGDDAMCEKYVAAVESDSAAARVTPALRAMMRQKQTLTPAAIALVSRAGGSVEKLRDTLKSLDKALDSRKQAQILPQIRTAVTLSQQVEPAVLQRLKQHISVRAMLAGMKPDPVATAMQGPSLKSAYFWRLIARGTEEEEHNPVAIPIACSYWEEFRRHAIHEGWFPGQGPEVAALYLHMADLWLKLSPDIVEEVQDNFASRFPGHGSYYRGQPPEIRALVAKPGPPDLYFLSPFSSLERACFADPCSENFQRWLRCAVENSSDHTDSVAERWSAALPNDIPPLLHLMESAEKRNALKKAFTFMERAEQIDGLNSEVRRARLRLLVSMAMRHLKDRKARLAEGELRQLEALPQAQHGDRPAFITALRWACDRLGGPAKSTPDLRAEVVRLLGGELAAEVVFAGLSQRCGLGVIEPAAPPKGVQISSAIGRACALGDDMGTPFEIPPRLFDRLERELSAKDFKAPVIPLVALGEAAIRQNLSKMGYAIAGAGLAQGPEGQARFLYLRARGMPPWESDRRAECLAGASELARRQRDSDLLNRIGEWRDEEMDWLDGPPDADTTTISVEEISRVVEREAKERGYPKPQPGVRDDDGNECQCPECCARRGEPSLPPELEAMVEELGPDVVAEALAEILGIGGGGKKKRPKRRNPFFGRDSDILPF